MARATWTGSSVVLCGDDGQELASVARQLGDGDRVFTAMKPRTLQLGDDIDLAHGRAQDHVHAVAVEGRHVQPGILDGHARRSDGEAGAAPHPARLGGREVIPRAKVRDFAR